MKKSQTIHVQVIKLSCNSSFVCNRKPQEFNYPRRWVFTAQNRFFASKSLILITHEIMPCNPRKVFCIHNVHYFSFFVAFFCLFVVTNPKWLEEMSIYTFLSFRYSKLSLRLHIFRCKWNMHAWKDSGNMKKKEINDVFGVAKLSLMTNNGRIEVLEITSKETLSELLDWKIRFSNDYSYICIIMSRNEVSKLAGRKVKFGWWIMRNVFPRGQRLLASLRFTQVTILERWDFFWEINAVFFGFLNEICFLRTTSWKS